MNYIEDLAVRLHETSKSKGFWDGAHTHDRFMAKLNYVHEEVSEVTQAYKKAKGSYKITEEIADILIRTLDWYEAAKDAGIVEDSLSEVLYSKMETNQGRANLHGKVVG